MRQRLFLSLALIAAISASVASTVGLAQENEARVRYIMADVALGGSLGYYAGHANDPNSMEAVRRLQSGVQVMNPQSFERKLLTDGWTITYAGTNRAIDGMDVRLTTDN